jgi:hypothetical protein
MIKIIYFSVSQRVHRGSQRICNQFPGDPWTHFYNGKLEVSLFLNWRNNISLKIVAEFLEIITPHFLMTVRISNQETPLATKRGGQVMQCTVTYATGTYYN